MPARKCSMCGTLWPMLQEYRDCPRCDEPTWISDSSEPLDPAEARSIRNHVQFEQFLVENNR